MDDYKKCSCKEIGPGGMNCACCGPSPGKERKQLRRRTRRRLKQELREQRGEEKNETKKVES